MSRRSNNEIDQRAQKVFRSRLPDNWVPYTQNPDQFHIDYVVRLRENDEPTGLEFGVQLKGTQRLSKRSNHVAFSFKTKHLRYWLAKSPLPVCVVVIDTTAGIGYWMFVNDWPQAASTAWRAKKSVDLRIPRCQQLTNLQLWSDALSRADVWIREMRAPASTTGSVNEVRRLQELDPRLRAEITVSGELITTTLRAVAPIAIGIRATEPDSATRLGHVFETGEAATFAPGEIALAGSPVAEEISAQLALHESRIEVRSRAPVVFSIYAGTGEGSEAIAYAGVNGALVGGSKLLRIETDAGTPFQISGTCDLRQSGRVSGAFRMHVHLESFEGHKLRALPYFDAFAAAVRTLGRATSCTVACESRGIKLFSFALGVDAAQDLALWAMPWVDIISKAQAVAAHLGVNANLRNLDDLAGASRGAIETLYGLLDGDWHSESAEHLSGSGEFELLPDLQLPESGTGKSIQIALTPEFFGCGCDGWLLEQHFSGVAVSFAMLAPTRGEAAARVATLLLAGAPGARVRQRLVRASATHTAGPGSGGEPISTAGG